MNCMNCGAFLTDMDLDYCPNCGYNVLIQKKVDYLSKIFYNQGLEKARVRDLTGAVTALKTSLSLNKKNIKARNLLGLVYYEMGELAKEIDSISTKAAFNGTKLLNGHFSGKQLQVGAVKGENMEITIKKMSASILFGAKGSVVAGNTSSAGNVLNMYTHSKASEAMSLITSAIKVVSAARSELGAKQNRLEYTIDNLENYSENLTSAESQIRDTDMATEMTNYTKNNILQQAAQSMLAQANQSTQGVLSLLQ